MECVSVKIYFRTSCLQREVMHVISYNTKVRHHLPNTTPPNISVSQHLHHSSASRCYVKSLKHVKDLLDRTLATLLACNIFLQSALFNLGLLEQSGNLLKFLAPNMNTQPTWGGSASRCPYFLLKRSWRISQSRRRDSSVAIYLLSHCSLGQMQVLAARAFMSLIPDARSRYSSKVLADFKAIENICVWSSTGRFVI